MKHELALVMVVALVLLAACAAPADVAPPPPPPEPPAPAVAPLPGPAPRIASVLEAYRAVERLEVPAITSAGVTVEFVRKVHAADAEARRALDLLVRHGGHATQADLNQARAAVHAVASVLDQIS